jgi:uncharacterized protein YbdZ (MbtH family)
VSINPFDDDDGRVRVLINGEEQHGLWPTYADVPAGWGTAHGKADRAACADHIEFSWTDIQPTNLRERLLATRPSSR